MRRVTSVWFLIAGLLAAFRWVLDLGDVQYYDPESAWDYLGVMSQSAAGAATGIALVLLSRTPPAERGSTLLAVAGVAAVTHGVGNLLEDAFGIEAAVWAFFAGGVVMMVALWAAGFLLLATASATRRIGVLLVIGGFGGMLGFGLLLMGLAWIGISLWILRQLSEANRSTLNHQPSN